jgi:hypothetical protein
MRLYEMMAVNIEIDGTGKDEVVSRKFKVQATRILKCHENVSRDIWCPAKCLKSLAFY